jgi:hypothetical protein
LFLIVASAIVGVLATLATALAFFGSAWWGFDWLANLRWYLLWMLVIAAIIYSLTAKGWLLVVFVVALGIQPTGFDRLTPMYCSSLKGRR